MENSLHECKQCGEPTEKEFCKACELIEKIKSEKIKIKNKKLKTKKKKQITTSKKYNKSLTCATTKGK